MEKMSKWQNSCSHIMPLYLETKSTFTLKLENGYHKCDRWEKNVGFSRNQLGLTSSSNQNIQIVPRATPRITESPQTPPRASFIQLGPPASTTNNRKSSPSDGQTVNSRATQQQIEELIQKNQTLKNQNIELNHSNTELSSRLGTAQAQIRQLHQHSSIIQQQLNDSQAQIQELQEQIRKVQLKNYQQALQSE
jgi:DNA-binding transcriptional MerR regulator